MKFFKTLEKNKKTLKISVKFLFRRLI